MEHFPILQLAFQVLLLLGSFTSVVFLYVFLTSSTAKAAIRKIICPPLPNRI